jgi:ethanolamine utilization protein EutS
MVGKELTGVSRVIEESVPGKQVTIAHVIASPVPEVYEELTQREPSVS